MRSAFAGTIYPVANRGEHLRILQKPFSTNALRDAVVMLLDLVAAAWAIRRRRSVEHRSADAAGWPAMRRAGVVIHVPARTGRGWRRCGSRYPSVSCGKFVRHVLERHARR